MGIRTIGYSLFRLLHFKIIEKFFGLLSHRTNGFSDCWVFGPMTRRNNDTFFCTIGILDQRAFGLVSVMLQNNNDVSCVNGT